MKPRLRRFREMWQCTYPGTDAGYAATKELAYQDWLNALRWSAPTLYWHS